MKIFSVLLSCVIIFSVYLLTGITTVESKNGRRVVPTDAENVIMKKLQYVIYAEIISRYKQTFPCGAEPGVNLELWEYDPPDGKQVHISIHLASNPPIIYGNSEMITGAYLNNLDSDEAIIQAARDKVEDTFEERQKDWITKTRKLKGERFMFMQMPTCPLFWQNKLQQISR